ncbi:S-adenosyl-L-methionine-dependent methyltransferase [Saccharata proteae CBS 121410]|uniref:S-adenosyl-L-methionine-dependent methyltransferase n=1 Tax=Saccharata proteae CBS 121410 TaxID=1314787 RepID=A0A9P4LUP5_9PEZI|nr:S-adenosyl-L-methionine-dependent methyltransferase [Saccharata proteae CBS 121410]
MSRIPRALVQRAAKIDSLLPLLLRPCRDIESAQNELRWLREHAQAKSHGHSLGWRPRLDKMVRERARGKPLQYILGTTYFGDLELVCEPGVLIPRYATAASVTHLAEKLKASGTLPASLRVLDLCTGSGCIPLLFENLFRNYESALELKLLGVDLSTSAINLARRNKERTGSINTDFAVANVLAEDSGAGLLPSLPSLLKALNSLQWDILISNPPYISPSVFRSTTARSVQDYEPHLALVPPKTPAPSNLDPGDTFYPRLLEIGGHIGAKVVLFEVGDLEQAKRVAMMARGTELWTGIEIWKDEPAAKNSDGVLVVNDHQGINVVGEGNGRSVVCWRGEGANWIQAT